MPNQMIALQARSPQLPNAAAQTAKFVNMMNMTKQQEAAERQAAQAQQAMDIEAAKEARAVQTQTATMREKDLDIEDKEMARLYKIGAALLETEDPTAREAGYQNLLGLIEQTSPQLGATMRRVANTFNPQVLQSVMMETEQYFNKKYATPIASLELREDGTPVSVQVGGLNPEQRPVYDAPPPMANAPRTTPTAPQAAPANPMASGYKPNTAAADPGSLSLVINSALETGVMAKADFDKMLSLAPPESRAKIAAWAQQNNIQVTPDVPGVTDNQMRGAPNEMRASPMSYDGQTPESQFAVYRGEPMQSQTAGLRGAPPMEQTLAQTQPRTVSKLQRRDPSVSPTPGVYNVPTQDVAATSRATRPSAGEVYDTELAKIKAARAAGPAPSTPKEKRIRQTEVAKAYSQAQSLIDKTYDPKEGAVALARKIKSLSSDQKEAITGFSGYVPSFRESSREADTLIGNLKGVVTALGKDAAAASGAIGPMAVQEWKIVSDQIANLDLEGMTPRALDAQMDRIIQQVTNATRLAERVYDVQFGDDLKEYPSFKLRGIPPTKAKTPVTKAPPGVSATEWKAMTPAERKLWQ
jgi:hypothetical protein